MRQIISIVGDDTILSPYKVIHLIVQHNVGEDLSYS